MEIVACRVITTGNRGSHLISSDSYMDCNFISVARVGKYLEGMNGRQVLGMKREDLETAFGEHEGKRLDSQITLSRSEDITSSQSDICFYNI